MSQNLYYIGSHDKDGKLLVYCQNNNWKPYCECEQNWNQVLLTTSPEAYKLKNDLLMTQNNNHGFTDSQIHVRSNQYQRMVYALLSYDESSERWQVKSKCLADSWSQAAKLFEVDPNIAQHSWTKRIAHYSDLPSYDDAVLLTVNSMRILHQ